MNTTWRKTQSASEYRRLCAQLDKRWSRGERNLPVLLPPGTPDPPPWAIDFSRHGEDGHPEWICTHNVGHGGVHTCDGCCHETSNVLTVSAGDTKSTPDIPCA